MPLPFEADLIAEREAIIETLDSLSDEEFDEGETLCAEWAPRDVLAHLMGVDTAAVRYARAMGNVRKANAEIVHAARHQPRARLMYRARHWAEHPAPLTRAAAGFFLGDTAVHHQDILRPRHRDYDVPPASAAAIFREGFVLGGFLKLREFRLEPTDGARPIGFGRPVRGTQKALGLWLAGRRGLDEELEFG